METTVQGKIESLAFGGQGILRKEGLVIFVPFTAPGDLVTCRITKKKSSFAEAEVLTIDQPSPQRITPRCPYFGVCGGCQLQHLNEAAQLSYKQQAVEDALKRIGQLELDSVLPIIPATQQWAYRRHVQLSLRQAKGTNQGFIAGYIAVDNRSLVQAEVCPIFIPDSEMVLKQLQHFCQQLVSDPHNEGKVTLLKQDQGQNQGNYLLHFHFKFSPKNMQEACEKALKQWKNWTGIVVSTPKGRKTFGQVQCKMKIDELEFSFSSDAFIQNHPEQSLNIYRHLVKIAQQEGASRALDLYCGIGCTSLLLAGQMEKVVGFESNKEAVRLAKENGVANQVKNVEFFCADVKDVLGEWIEKLKADFVVVNPPRIGLDPRVIEGLIAHRPKEIVYISCMPATLARDLHLLVKQGYRMKSCQAFDMFPQTAHVETVVHLKNEG